MSVRGTKRVHAGRGAAVAVEALEERTLLTGMIADLATLPSPITAGAMAVSGSTLWFAEQGRTAGPALGELQPSGTMTVLPLPADDAGGTIASVVADSSGDVWYTVDLNPSNGGPAGRIGKVGPDGQITEVSLPSTADTPGAATIGPDGNLWVAVTNPDQTPAIDRVSATTGAVTSFPVAGALGIDWLISGPYDDLWFVDGPRIGKMTTTGAVTEYLIQPAPGQAQVDLSNAQLTEGSDGNVWFLGRGGLSMITPTGTVTTMATTGTTITSLTAGSDGNLWISFTAPTDGPLAGTPGAVVARVSTSGQTYIVPNRVDPSTAVVGEMAAGSDASIWLNESGTGLSRLNLAGVPAMTMPIVSPVSLGMLQTRPNGTLIGIVGSFSANYDSAQASDFSVTINWGDGHTSNGIVEEDQSGNFDILGANHYTTPPGTEELIEFDITGPNGAEAETFEAVTVEGRARRVPVAKKAETTTTTDTVPTKAKASDTKKS